MARQQPQITSLLKKLAKEPAAAEVVYVNHRLLDDLFESRFGGVTKLLESIEQTSERALKAVLGAGFGGILAKLFLDFKAGIAAEGKIGEQTKTVVERELTLPKKVRLCEASLVEEGLILENPPDLAGLKGKYLRLVDRLYTFTSGDEYRLKAEIGDNAAKIVIDRWRKDQELTPGSPQVMLATARPFKVAAIVKVQPEVAGSTYIAYPPASPARRVVLAEPLVEESDVTFLKTFWVIDIRPN